MEKLVKFFKDEEGASGVEYGIMIAAIAALIAAIAFLIGTKVSGAFSKTEAAIPIQTK